MIVVKNILMTYSIVTIGPAVETFEATNIEYESGLLS